MSTDTKNRICIALGLLAALLAQACGVASMQNLAERHEPQGSLQRPPKPHLLVVTASDARPDGTESSIAAGYLVFVPVVPFGKQSWTPERMKPAYSLPADVAAAVAKDLRAAGLFQDVQMSAQAATTGAKNAAAADGAYTLKLDVDRGHWIRYYTTYGLSIAGVALWYLGAPVAYGHNELGFHARLLDPSGATVAEANFYAEASVTESEYQTLPFGTTWGEFHTCFHEIAPQVRAFVANAALQLAGR